MTAEDYAIYLKSIHWRSFRKFALKERGGACEECGISNVWACMSYGEPLNVHHVSYAHLGQERPEDVRVLCRRCHESVHGAPTFPDMSDAFWKICRAVKEAPEIAWEWLRTLDRLSVGDLHQLSLPLSP